MTGTHITLNPASARTSLRENMRKQEHNSEEMYGITCHSSEQLRETVTKTRDLIDRAETLALSEDDVLELGDRIRRCKAELRRRSEATVVGPDDRGVLLTHMVNAKGQELVYGWNPKREATYIGTRRNGRIVTTDRKRSNGRGDYRDLIRNVRKWGGYIISTTEADLIGSSVKR